MKDTKQRIKELEKRIKNLEKREKELYKVVGKTFEAQFKINDTFEKQIEIIKNFILKFC